MSYLKEMNRPMTTGSKSNMLTATTKQAVINAMEEDEPSPPVYKFVLIDRQNARLATSRTTKSKPLSQQTKAASHSISISKETTSVKTTSSLAINSLAPKDSTGKISNKKKTT
jgi:hypothetical protein